MTRVAILWHMHQPFYQDLVTGEHTLPWVRMHALKDYYGMVALLREFPGVKMTFNLVPSLLVQLEAFADDRAHDRALALSLKPADELNEDDVAYIRSNFFHAPPHRMIEIYPRYAELHARRNRAYGVADWRDLQVWHKLAWVDPLYLEGDDRVRQLVARGRDFSEDDKATLREVELEILNRIVPEYRDASARGQIEVSASPFYHPILPLLCDTDVYLVTHPDARKPRRRFIHPEDALEQLTRAAAYHERLFGRRPDGLWPSEGSVSDAMVPLAAQAGFRWMATDELILARSTGATFSRDGHGHIEQPDRLYRPYIVATRDASIACVFRDHVLSDLIGFTYANWRPEAAADDFVGRLVEGGRRFRARGNGEDPVIPVILDGENAWEHFEGGGRRFLRALYSRLQNHPELTTVTMAEAVAGASSELSGIFPGSWIDANFYIWIGHPDDQKAWGQLADARLALEAADRSAAAPDAARARDEILVAEGSDWCWWYGDDHSSPNDPEFDELFRLHLRNAYELMGLVVPDELFFSNISSGSAQPVQTHPTALLAPVLDGVETSYFEWLGAGEYHVREVAGSMHRVDRREPILSGIRFGVSREELFVRLDSRRAFGEVLAEGYGITLTFLTPAGVRVAIRQSAGRLTASFWERDTRHAWRRRSGSPTAVAADVLEVAMPFVELGIPSGGSIAFFAGVEDAAGNELERHPAQRPIELAAPDALYEARSWRA